MTPLNSSSILIDIQPPLTPNGIITKYTINRVSDGTVVYTHEPVLMMNSISYIDTGLSPYTVYQYSVTAFTVAGNTIGNISSARTLEAPPTGLDPPSAILTDDTSIFIGWQAPLEANGVITSYSILRQSHDGYHPGGADNLLGVLGDACPYYLDYLDGSGGFEQLFFLTVVDGETTSYIDGGLNPYTYYGYCVFASNGAGSTVSSPSNIILTSPAVQPLAGPNVTASTINSTAITVTWSGPDPSDLLGPLTSYTLYMKEADDEEGLGNKVLSGLGTLYIATGLSPSTTYTFTVIINYSC